MTSWRKHLLFYLFIAMIGALFFSRAVLSICMMAFVVVSFLHNDIKGHIRAFFSSPVLWAMSLLFILPFISGLWSEDKKEWLSILRLKLPLLALPLAFAGPFSFSKKEWSAAAFIFIAFVVGGTVWSMFHYASDIQGINASYLKAKAIATPLRNDHVRFSWMVSITALLCAVLARQMRKQSKLITTVMAFCGVWLSLFLHIIAVRTGLFSLYIMVLAISAWLILSKAKPGYGILVLSVLLLLPFAAYQVLPSFQNRVHYILYDYSYFKEQHYLPGGNDAARVVSLRAGWDLLLENPLSGTGTGDIRNEVQKWDRAHYPGILATDMIYPSSEWLVYGLTMGWAGVVLFTIIILIPCFTRRKENPAWLLLNLTAVFSFLFDMGLEVQFGIFLYAFFVLWWWKWLEPQKEITLQND